MTLPRLVPTLLTTKEAADFLRYRTTSGIRTAVSRGVLRPIGVGQSSEFGVRSVPASDGNIQPFAKPGALTASSRALCSRRISASSGSESSALAVALTSSSPPRVSGRG
jgi:hypothetical protein